MADRDVRIPYVRRCVVERGTQRSDAVVYNLGAHGASLTFFSARGSVIPLEGDGVSLSFTLPRDPERVHVPAQVTRRHAGRETTFGHGRGCEVRFASLRAEDDRRLRDLIEDYQTRRQPRIAVAPPRSGALRIPYVEPCLLVGEEATWEGVVCNLSVLGAYVSAQPSPAAFDVVRLCVRMPGAADPLEMGCEVVWTWPDDPAHADGLPPGCGLRFLDDAARPEIELLLLEYASLPRS